MSVYIRACPILAFQSGKKKNYQVQIFSWKVTIEEIECKFDCHKREKSSTV